MGRRDEEILARLDRIEHRLGLDTVEEALGIPRYSYQACASRSPEFTFGASSYTLRCSLRAGHDGEHTHFPMLGTKLRVKWSA